MTDTTIDYLDLLIRYEQDEVTEDEAITLFQHLIDTGQAWSLQGHYGRTASALIDAGYCTAPGGD